MTTTYNDLIRHIEHDHEFEGGDTLTPLGVIIVHAELHAAEVQAVPSDESPLPVIDHDRHDFR